MPCFTLFGLVNKVNMSKLKFVRSFRAAMKESVQCAAHWAVCYHCQRSWYPKPDTGGVMILAHASVTFSALPYPLSK